MKQIYETLNNFLNIAKELYCLTFENIAIKYEEMIEDTAFGKREVYKIIRRV